jgi:hypothetical protein
MRISGMWPEIERMLFLPRVTRDTMARIPFISEMWVGFVYRTSVGSDDEGGTMPHTMLVDGVVSVEGNNIKYANGKK